MERKLVTIRKVKEINPIKNADFIELAKVDGWQCVVKKGEFQVGDLGIYFEIDSFLPIRPEFEFLRKQCYKKLVTGEEGFRLRTIKLKKKLSQGLLLPLKTFQDISDIDTNIGIDLSEKLNVIKYEPPIPAQLSGVVKGNFPSFIQKTDEERIQNLTEYFELYKDVEFEESEKEDGSSVSYFFNEKEFGVCSRNLELKEAENNTLWTVAKQIGIKESLEQCGKNVAVQGELVGEGINKNPLLIKGQEFHIFNVYDIDKVGYMTPDDRMNFIKSLNNDKLKHVPIIKDIIKIFQECKTVDSLLDYAKGVTTMNPNKQREGLVFKANVFDENNQLISFKVINNELLLDDNID